jgi:hypothetical protein
MPPSPSLLARKARDAQDLARRVLAGIHVTESLAALQELFPGFHFYNDENYGLSVVCDRHGQGMPHGLLHALNHAIIVEPNDGGILHLVTFKDRSGRLRGEPREVVRLFQVVTGLTPDGEMGQQTVNQMRVVHGGKPEPKLERLSVWERIMEDDR